MNHLHLLGLDFGSTTSSAIMAAARVQRNSATGRMELSQQTVIYRSELVFTPFCADQIDEAALGEQLDRWIRQSGVDPNSVASGGVIITGLAAQKTNVAAIEALVKRRVGEALFATADDPCLESWLAFMGSCYALSRTHPDRFFLNLDIGGGTTNLALGRNGEILRTGCLFAGARHFQFAPGSYRITALSRCADRLLGDLKIEKSISASLSPDELRRILDFYVTLIEAAVAGVRSRFDHDPFRYHEQVPYIPEIICSPACGAKELPVVTFSGGVGELIYQHAHGRPMPPTTAFGDLGIDLAQRLIQSPVLSGDLNTYIPMNFGHATVYGLCLYSTELSGTTLYLPDPGILPLRDLPIVAKLSLSDSPAEIGRAVGLAGRSARGACIEIARMASDVAAVKQFGEYLAGALRDSCFPADRPLVLFVPQNIGKTIGSYATDWGRLPVRLIVIDEVPGRNARFATLGELRNNIVPVSFYGLTEPLESGAEPPLPACPAGKRD